MLNWIISEKSLEHPARTGGKLFLIAFLLLTIMKAIFPTLSYQSGGFIVPFIPMIFAALFFGQKHGQQIPKSTTAAIACSYAGYIGFFMFLVALLAGHVSQESARSTMAIVLFLTTLQGAFAYLFLRAFSLIGTKMRGTTQARELQSKRQTKLTPTR